MPKFTPEFLDELKARVRISDVVGRHVKLQRRGNAWWGLSPFKTEKTPSFTVSDDRRSYHCFSTQNHGDAIKFLQDTQGLSFTEAVTRLASDAGMTLPAEDPGAAERSRVRRGLSDACSAAAAFYARALRSREGREAAEYLQRRGVDEAAIAAFGIGYAPAGRTALRDHLLDKGFSEKALVEAGLLIEPDDEGHGRGATFDRFRGRVMFPIMKGGETIAFGGRALDPAARAKYLNSPETPIFRKGEVLYNYDAARSVVSSAQARIGGGSPAIDPKTRLIVCEGYMDVIALWGGGFRGAVAPLGTALTEDQIRLLWRIDDEPLICLDGDDAGRKAAYRALERALPLLSPGRSLGFVFLTKGQDPDDLIRSDGPEAFASAAVAAAPLADVLWRRETEAARLDTPERRTAFRKGLRDLVRSIADKDVRAAYGEEFAARLGEMAAARRAPQGHAGEARGPGRGQPGPAGGFNAAGFRGRGRYRSEHEARLAGSRPSGEAMRARAPGGVRACEATLLLCLLSRPEIAREVEEVLFALEFQDPGLDRLLGEIVCAIAADPDLDSEALRRHVEGSPTADLYRDLANDRWLLRQMFLRPDAGQSEVEAGWRATWRRYTLITQVERELVESASSVFSDGDDGWRAAAAARSRFDHSDGEREGGDGDEGASSADLAARLERMKSSFN